MPVSLDQSEHVLAKLPATQVIALTACFNSHLETFDQLPTATVGLCGHEDSAPAVWKSFYRRAFPPLR